MLRSSIEKIHQSWIVPRRAERLVSHLSELIPEGETVLDVGAGDGSISALLAHLRSDLSITAIDVAVRPEAAFPITEFDGEVLPFRDQEFDTVTFVDVLHHTNNALDLLYEAKRVARHSVVLKDHLLQGFLASTTLRQMDHVGNDRHGIPVPYNYWDRDEWTSAFQRVGLEPVDWRSDLGLYPLPITWFCDRSLHFVTRLRTS